MKAAIAREPDAVERILTEYEADAGPAPIADHRDDIDRLFAGETLEDVVAALEADGIGLGAGAAGDDGGRSRR